MGRLTVCAAIALLFAGCSPEAEVVGSTNKCAAGLYPSFNPKNLNQCVGACIKCDRGTQTTCSTSCTLRGAK